MSDAPTRRTFVLGSAAALAAAPAFAAANSRVVVGVMGTGGQGTLLARTFAGLPNVTVATVSDVDPARANKAADTVAATGAARPAVAGDFRRILDDKAVDLFVCAAPNHWHAPAGVLALAAGKHCYIEKPCGHNPREGELLAQAAAKSDRKMQIGTMRRSWPKLQEAVQRIREGELGRVSFAQAFYFNNRAATGTGKAGTPPAGLDYDLWQGPAPRRPFRTTTLHYTWHWFWHWGNGELGNNGVHTLDVVRWALNLDAPERVTSVGGRYRFRDDQETPDTQIAGIDFPGGVSVMWEGLSCDRIPTRDPFDIVFHGEKGALVVSGSGYSVHDPKGKELQKVAGPGGYVTHAANLMAAIRDGAPLACPASEGAASTLLCHLGNIAHRTGRALKCDPASGRVVNDPDAMKLWGRDYEAGWEPSVRS